MRLLEQYQQQNFTVSIFQWNGKYQVKIEQGPLIQEYKIPEDRISNGVDQIKMLVSTDFITQAKTIFDLMGSNLIDNYKKTIE